MLDRVAALIVDEGKWLTVSMTVALMALATLAWRHRHGPHPRRRLVMAGMNLFVGVTLAMMGIGHLLAVTTKLALGTLAGAPLILYPIGLAVSVPSWMIVLHTRELLRSDDVSGRTAALNAWLAGTLAVLGLHNLPLAAPALLNVGYSLHSRRAIGWALVSLAVLVNAGLFVGSVLFFLSGQSFEQFTGIEP
jgi:hypothetical protein